ncbi:MAG: ABC transporter ATP-binding protein/permease [Raoultibacter sp.]|jgi:ABC-type transport system involved in cytochrome bd biosynthesis fused ATPase/permease subunit
MINGRLIGLAKNSMKYVYGNILLQWIALLGMVAIIFSVSILLESFLVGTTSTELIISTALIAGAGIIIRFICSIGVSKTSFLAADKVKLTLREAIYSKILKLGSSYHENMGTSEILQVAVEGVDQLEIYFSKYLPQFFYSLLAPITLFIILGFVNLPAALALLLCVPLIPLSIMLVQRIAKKLLKQYWGVYTDLGAGFLENIQGLTTLKVFKADEAKNIEMNEQSESFRKITMRVLTMQLNSITVMDIIAYGGSAVGIIFAISAFAGGSLSFAGCLAIILLASEFFIPLRLLGSFFHIAMNGIAASQKMFTLLDMPEPQDGTINTASFEGSIEFQNVDFSYDGKRQILTTINLKLEPGINALVGESGCGKSTIASLLAGRQSGYSGVIKIDGTSLSEYSHSWLSRNITYIGHNSFLFSGSVRDNLLMGAATSSRPHPSDDELWKTLDQVRLSDFLREQEGLDTMLKEQASNLSGGQRQRLALARALLHDSPIYIFDEASSNIDVESENDITSIIWELGAQKTILFISHRLANVIPAHRISMMEAGRIVEEGKHEVLLAQGGPYAKMFSTQCELESIARKEVEIA